MNSQNKYLNKVHQLSIAAARTRALIKSIELECKDAEEREAFAPALARLHDANDVLLQARNNILDALSTRV